MQPGLPGDPQLVADRAAGCHGFMLRPSRPAAGRPPHPPTQPRKARLRDHVVTARQEDKSAILAANEEVPMTKTASVHEVKSWSGCFMRLASGSRTHELRRADRDYKVGDMLSLNEWDPVTNSYTGRTCAVRITDIVSALDPCPEFSSAIHPDYLLLSVSLVSDIGRDLRDPDTAR